MQIIQVAMRPMRQMLWGMVPSSPSLAEHLGQLLESKAGIDVTFAVSGESFAAHKNVLAARSPVFKAEFFGEMIQKSSGHVEIKEMEPSVFAAMLGFLYTDRGAGAGGQDDGEDDGGVHSGVGCSRQGFEIQVFVRVIKTCKLFKNNYLLATSIADVTD
ncbi:hypothetical protein HU200_063408 [Digitaria exilis]|uniref:BTB domain-containing protein n=1 Tax=Digitaria exilis TaxID=1010633 RepID=A0A835A5Y4_9POAL|nr:hypothetical protein HU200_063408 [Digitaria exilis]